MSISIETTVPISINFVFEPIDNTSCVVSEMRYYLLLTLFIPYSNCLNLNFNLLGGLLRACQAVGGDPSPAEELGREAGPGQGILGATGERAHTTTYW